MHWFVCVIVLNTSGNNKLYAHVHKQECYKITKYYVFIFVFMHWFSNMFNILTAYLCDHKCLAHLYCGTVFDLQSLARCLLGL